MRRVWAQPHVEFENMKKATQNYLEKHLHMLKVCNYKYPLAPKYNIGKNFLCYTLNQTSGISKTENI